MPGKKDERSKKSKSYIVVKKNSTTQIPPDPQPRESTNKAIDPPQSPPSES